MKTVRTIFPPLFVTCAARKQSFHLSLFHRFDFCESRFPMLYYLGAAFTQSINPATCFPHGRFLASFTPADSHSPSAGRFAKSFIEVTRAWLVERSSRNDVGGKTRETGIAGAIGPRNRVYPKDKYHEDLSVFCLDKIAHGKHVGQFENDTHGLTKRFNAFRCVSPYASPLVPLFSWRLLSIDIPRQIISIALFTQQLEIILRVSN